MKNLFGIMQGRLLPKYKGKYQAHPVGYWDREFIIAKNFGFDCIEFILDYDESELNPLLSQSGLKKIQYYSQKTNILVKSVCADYFMKSPIFLENKLIKKNNLRVLRKLIKSCQIIGIKDIVIPLVDSSSLRNSKKKTEAAIRFLSEIICNIIPEINICLETDLPPQEFYEFVNNIDKPQIKINYDTGNSASLGYDFHEEFDNYCHLITNIHIKDRLFKGGSVELGSGNCNFEEIFSYLAEKKYNGLFVLQAYRGEDGISSTITQYNYAKNLLNKYFNF